ncbi:hypothetical protein AB0F18_33930 [Streptomyces sp. NPDC029216]|uniref:hypothetical protein n=1 Tax=Streptomyces sp. NPDC029216 TaxID=3154701 RepID=UPI0033D9ADE3
MAWKWNPFKRGKGKEEAPAPEPTPQAPAAPAPAPAPEPKKPGRLRRMFSRKKKAEAPPEAPPTAPAAPPTGPPAPPPAAPPAAEGPEEGPEGEEGEEGEEEEEREYPGALGVSADGVWQISSTQWDGIMHGVLHGEEVKDFIKSMERGDLATAAGMVAMAYDETVGTLINTQASTIRHIGF